MMEIRLVSLNIDNFKGIKTLKLNLVQMSLDEQSISNAVIRAANGSGKTSVYDAFLWLLFGKDSLGRKEFGRHPQDENRQPISGVVTSVEAVLSIDGMEHVFRKECKEKSVKGQITGFETATWIDEVPKKIGVYAKAIEKIIKEDTFRALTDLSYFNQKLSWQERRKILLDIAGDIGTPKGFGELIGAAKGRPLADYKKVLTDEKKLLTTERDEIGPRMDEIQKGGIQAEQVESVDGSADFGKRRVEVLKRLDMLTEQRAVAATKEADRRQAIDNATDLKARKAQREIDLKSQVNEAVQGLREEQQKYHDGLATQAAEITILKNQTGLKTTLLDGHKAIRITAQESLVRIRDEHKRLKDETKTAANVCPTCGQQIPIEDIKKTNDSHKQLLAQIGSRGAVAKKNVQNEQEKIQNIQQQLVALGDELTHAEEDLVKVTPEAQKAIAKLQDIIDTHTTPPPEKDVIWLTICEEIKKAEQEAGPNLTEQMQVCESQRTELTNELAYLDKKLAAADREKQDKGRLVELTERRVDLAQKIAYCNSRLNDISEYTAEEGNLLEEAVNGRFKHVRWVLHNEMFNGSVEDTCLATFHGVN